MRTPVPRSHRTRHRAAALERRLAAAEAHAAACEAFAVKLLVCDQLGLPLVFADRLTGDTPAEWTADARHLAELRDHLAGR